MPSETDIGPLGDMRHYGEAARNFTEGQTYESLRDDLMRLYAVIRCLEIISEASRRLSADLKARHPHIPWQQMAAAGNFYRHDYEDVTPRRVWKTVQEDLPPLLAVLDEELARDG